MIATEIQWSIDFNDAFETIEDMPYEDAAESLGLPAERYANMTSAEREAYAYDVYRHSPSTIEAVLELPDEVEIPEELADISDEDYEENISDWLSDEYGYCHEGFVLDDGNTYETSIDEQELRRLEKKLAKELNVPYVLCTYDALCSHKINDEEELTSRREDGLLGDNEFVIDYELYQSEQDRKESRGGYDGEVHELIYTIDNNRITVKEY